MARHLLLLTVMVLLIHENMPSANPQLGASYYQSAFSSYYQSAPGPCAQVAVSPYYQQQQETAVGPFYRPPLAPYYPQEPADIGFGAQSSYEEEENRLFFNFWRVCPRSAILFPCKCHRTRNPVGWGLYGTIICPEGLTAANIQTILGGVPAGLNIKSVVLNLNRGTNVANSVPASFTTNYPTATISIVNPNDASKCIDSSLLAPCTCELGKTRCPPGTSIAQIQAVFNKIAPHTNLGTVVITVLPDATIVIPANILGSNGANQIQILGPPNINPKSQLAIDSNAFTSSASTATQLLIATFDVVNVDYSLLANFNQLTTLQINNCANPPTVVNQPKNLPQNLPKLTTVSVDGTNILPNGR